MNDFIQRVLAAQGAAICAKLALEQDIKPQDECEICNEQRRLVDDAVNDLVEVIHALEICKQL